MMRARSFVVLAAIGLVVVGSQVLANQTVTLQITISPQRDNPSHYSGRYVASVNVVGGASAREVVFNINIPTAYEMDVSPQDIRIVDVLPGADVHSIAVQGHNEPVPVCFVESQAVNNNNSIWVVALLEDNDRDPKHVCDIVFTAHGRPTTSPLTLSDVAIKDGDVNLIGDQSNFGNNVPCPLFGDLDWDGAIGIRDFALFVAALRQGDNPAWADLMPLAQGSPQPSDPEHAVSAGDGAVGIADFAAWVMALRNAP